MCCTTHFPSLVWQCCVIILFASLLLLASFTAFYHIYSISVLIPFIHPFVVLCRHGHEKWGAVLPLWCHGGFHAATRWGLLSLSLSLLLSLSFRSSLSGCFPFFFWLTNFSAFRFSFLVFLKATCRCFWTWLTSTWIHSQHSMLQGMPMTHFFQSLARDTKFAKISYWALNFFAGSTLKTVTAGDRYYWKKGFQVTLFPCVFHYSFLPLTFLFLLCLCVVFVIAIVQLTLFINYKTWVTKCYRCL